MRETQSLEEQARTLSLCEDRPRFHLVAAEDAMDDGDLDLARASLSRALESVPPGTPDADEAAFTAVRLELACAAEHEARLQVQALVDRMDPCDPVWNRRVRTLIQSAPPLGHNIRAGLSRLLPALPESDPVLVEQRGDAAGGDLGDRASTEGEEAGSGLPDCTPTAGAVHVMGEEEGVSPLPALPGEGEDWNPVVVVDSAGEAGAVDRTGAPLVSEETLPTLPGEEDPWGDAATSTGEPGRAEPPPPGRQQDEPQPAARFPDQTAGRPVALAGLPGAAGVGDGDQALVPAGERPDALPPPLPRAAPGGAGAGEWMLEPLAAGTSFVPAGFSGRVLVAEDDPLLSDADVGRDRLVDGMLATASDEDARILFETATTFLINRDFETAALMFSAAMQAPEFRFGACEGLMECLVGSEKYAEAIVNAARARRIYPHAGDALLGTVYLQGIAAQMVGDKPLAQACFTHVAESAQADHFPDLDDRLAAVR